MAPVAARADFHLWDPNHDVGDASQPMVIGACTLHLYLPGVASLKDKRRIVKPLLIQLRRRFEVAAAEVDYQDVWQSADIALVAVSNSASHVHAVLDGAVRWVEDNYLQVQITDWDTELR